MSHSQGAAVQTFSSEHILAKRCCLDAVVCSLFLPLGMSIKQTLIIIIVLFECAKCNALMQNL